MKIKTILSAAIIATGLGACGQSADKKGQPETHTQAEMDHSDHEVTASEVTIGHGTGTVQSVSSEGDFLSIAHGPLEGIDMGAMTMGFEAAEGVDLSGITDGDDVAFMVEVDTAGDLQLTAICDTGDDGADCLRHKMEH